MAKAYQEFSIKVTSQNQEIPGKDQVKNNAGGYVFQTSIWNQLNRFLILGCEGGSFYTSESKMVLNNAKIVQECLKEDGVRVVKTIVEISDQGRAPKNDPALFALAICSAMGDEKTRAEAFKVLPKVARISTHLFQFMSYLSGLRNLGGRSIRNAIRTWYNNKSADDLAYQVIKYQQREGWSHRDLLRLGHVKPISENHNAIFNHIVKGTVIENKPESESLVKLWAAQEINKVKDRKKIIKLILDYNLPREVVPTELLTDPNVWEALLVKMPLIAMIRNLGNMTKVGLLKPLSEAAVNVVRRLASQDQLKGSRIHPIAILSALKTYASGRSVRGDGIWSPVQAISDALESAFYLAFNNVEPTNKSTLLALDVSGSMAGGEVSGVPGLSPRAASAALALVTMAVESNVECIGFSTEIVKLNISPKMRLEDVIKNISNLPFARTDCAQPMLWASKNKIKAESFAIYTDSETWCGPIHPCQALNSYRKEMNVPARLAVIAMLANKFTIADPNDPGMLDFVGFDTSTPQLLSEFFKGNI